MAGGAVGVRRRCLQGLDTLDYRGNGQPAPPVAAPHREDPLTPAVAPTMTGRLRVSSDHPASFGNLQGLTNGSSPCNLAPRVAQFPRRGDDWVKGGIRTDSQTEGKPMVTADREPGQLGRLIRHYRRERGISQSDFAAAVGMSRSNLERIELQGLALLPRPSVVRALARELGIPITEILVTTGYLDQDPGGDEAETMTTQ
jgi:DNA-binding XRE family transcriptional regulator